MKTIVTIDKRLCEIVNGMFGEEFFGRRKRKSQLPLEQLGLSTGAPGRIRTRDPLVRSQVLYPTELPARRRIVILMIFSENANLFFKNDNIFLSDQGLKSQKFLFPFIFNNLTKNHPSDCKLSHLGLI